MGVKIPLTIITLSCRAQALPVPFHLVIYSTNNIKN